MPDIALAWCELLVALNSMRLSIFSTLTFGTIFCVSVPSGPFTAISPWVNVTSTFSGSTTG
ncbi:hypothetical protein D3C83_96850 [compost metagenome]